MGDNETNTPVLEESPLGYHPFSIWNLTYYSYPVGGQCQVGSLTGAVASKRVTEALKVHLNAVRNRIKECKGRRWINCETDKSSRYESRT